MQQEQITAYNARVVQASKGELVVISYELLLDFIKGAKEALDQKKEQEFKEDVSKAKKTLRSLMDGLDFNYDISKSLMSLYLHINQQLIKGSLKKDKTYLEQVEKLLAILLKGWQEAVKMTKEEPLITNGEKLYAGLTYGKGTLNEITISNSQRGYKA